MTQKELAAMSGINLATVMRLEAGKHKPKFKTAKAIARSLRMKPQDIEW